MVPLLTGPLKQTIFNNCPGGPCNLVRDYNEALLAVLVVDLLFFAVTLFPPAFSWNNRKPDGKTRIFFAIAACVTFYLWIAFLVVDSVYCFGFLAHQGPCANATAAAAAASSNDSSSSLTTTTYDDTAEDVSGDISGGEKSVEGPTPRAASLIEGILPSAINDSCDNNPVVLSEHEVDLRNVFVAHVLIIVVLVVTLIANAREALYAKALHYKETLCKTSEVQRFLNTLVSKPPEVGHYVSCSHPAKSGPDPKTNATRKVVTFSAIENFGYANWRDFSDPRLIDPSDIYPIIEINVVLNFFPGDHFTADKYKAFVLALTKAHSEKDAKIAIDDYFHIEDHREWTFFVGNHKFISPWWDHGFARVFFSCFLLFGWPMRLRYHGQIAKHQVEVKKAVFCQSTSQDEGVSMAATPGGSSAANETAATVESNKVAAATTNNGGLDKVDHVVNNSSGGGSNAVPASAAKAAAGDPEIPPPEYAPPSAQPPSAANHAALPPADAPVVNATGAPPGAPPYLPELQQQQQQLQQEQQPELRRHNEQLVNAVVSNPPPQQMNPHRHPPGGGPVQIMQQPIQMQQQQHQQHYHAQQQQQPQYTQNKLSSVAAAGGSGSSPPMPPQRSQPLASPRTQRRETTRDFVTAVAHSSDINGVSAAVNTVALKDIDVQMSALSGYETYV